MRKTRGGWGETRLTHFSRRHRPLSQVARVLFSLCSFQYVRTILSESLAQASGDTEIRKSILTIDHAQI